MASARAAATTRQARLGRRDGHEPGPRAQRAARGEHGGPRLPERARHDQHVPEVALVRARGGAAGRPRPRPGPRAGRATEHAAARLSAEMPMSATTSSPTWSQAGGSTWPRLGAPKVTVTVASAAGQSTRPAVGRHPGGQVDGDHRDARRRAGPRARRSPRARAPSARPGGRCRAPRPRSGRRPRPRAAAERPRRRVRDVAHAPAGPLAGQEVRPRVALDLLAASRAGAPRARPPRRRATTKPSPAVVAAPAQHDHAARPREAVAPRAAPPRPRRSP